MPAAAPRARPPRPPLPRASRTPRGFSARGLGAWTSRPRGPLAWRAPASPTAGASPVLCASAVFISPGAERTPQPPSHLRLPRGRQRLPSGGAGPRSSEQRGRGRWAAPLRRPRGPAPHLDGARPPSALGGGGRGARHRAALREGVRVAGSDSQLCQVADGHGLRGHGGSVGPGTGQGGAGGPRLRVAGAEARGLQAPAGPRRVGAARVFPVEIPEGCGHLAAFRSDQQPPRGVLSVSGFGNGSLRKCTWPRRPAPLSDSLRTGFRGCWPGLPSPLPFPQDLLLFWPFLLSVLAVPWWCPSSFSGNKLGFGGSSYSSLGSTSRRCVYIARAFRGVCRSLSVRTSLPSVALPASTPGWPEVGWRWVRGAASAVCVSSPGSRRVAEPSRIDRGLGDVRAVVPAQPLMYGC